ncbi:hypothetical protein GCM10023189_49360 [Nibrella saemangeumensis]|uniref:histidine kinase n=1 Tax=Nibrella saemangeumensis TaxID=1084526 RepID=A0ABP8NJ44_9BACT
MKKGFTVLLVSLLLWPLCAPAQITVADSLRRVLRQHAQADTTRVRLLNNLSRKLDTTRAAEASALSQEALQLARRLGDVTGEVNGLMVLADWADKQGEFDRAVAHYQTALSRAISSQSNRLQYAVLRDMSWLYQHHDQYDEALRLLKQQSKLLQPLGDKRLYIENLTKTAGAYLSKGDYSRALALASRASTIAEGFGDTLLMIQTRSELGILYTMLRDIDKAVEYQQKAYQLARQSPYKKWESIALSRMGEARLAQDKPKEAASLFRKALDVLEPLENEVVAVAICEGDLADALDRLGRHQEALTYGYRALATLKPTKNLSTNSWIEAILARTYLHISRLDSAILLGKRSFDMARQIGHKEFCRDASALLAEAYAKQNDYKTAYQYRNFHLAYKDSLLNDETSRRVAVLDNESKLSRTRARLALLEKDKQLQQVDAKRKELILWSLLAVVLLTLALVVLLVRNNQHKQQQADQLLALDELKTRFFSNITHEFRTPLSLIILPTEQLLREKNLSEAVRRGLSAVDRNARQLLRLINQLLDLSKLEAGSMSTAGLAGNPVEFIRQMVELFRPAAEGKGIQLVFTADSLATDCLFDADKWEKISYNLLSNALKFTPAGGRIQVNALLTNPQQLHVQVIDTGIGISADKLPRIFDRFYQVDQTRTRSYEGSGIGLALVKELTQLLNGQITVASEPGHGTRFDLYLPLRAAEGGEQPVSVLQAVPSPPFQVADSPEETTTTGSAGKPVILVVEDNNELREFIAQGLAETYQVLTAANGSEGWQRVQLDLPDIVLSDVMMPDMDGYELCRLIKESPETSHIAVVLLTARTSYESRIEGLSQGADDYLPKPFHFDELLLRIRNLLDRRQKVWDFYARQLSDPDASVLPELDEDPLLKKLSGIIDENLENTEFGVEELATEAGISRRTLNRKLTALAGISANDFIRRHRLKRAVELLRSGSGIAETAYRVGFENPSYFTSVFKEVYKVTPSEFVAR